jgi:hypothetical protein
MGMHSTPRGEESTYAGNGGKQNPIHVGKHRAKIKKLVSDENYEFHSLGKRTDANPKYTQSND